jgi:hypothetical protein
MKRSRNSLGVSEPSLGYDKLGGEVVLYSTPDGSMSLDVRLKQDTVWLTQAQMVRLFNRNQSVISRHIHNIFKEGELEEKSNMQKMHIAKFLWFLQKNASLYRADGTKPIADNALVAMTLLIAESRPEEKDLLTRVLVHLIHPERS